VGPRVLHRCEELEERLLLSAAAPYPWQGPQNSSGTGPQTFASIAAPYAPGPTGTTDPFALANAPDFHATSPDLTDVKNGPLAKGGEDLMRLYQQYAGWKAAGAAGIFYSPQSDLLYIDGSSVGVSVRAAGDIHAFLKSIDAVGFRSIAVNTDYQVVDGFLPIDQLPACAQWPSVINLRPIYRPVTNTQGVANNQADETLKSDLARAAFNVSGAGVKIGVLSDSANRYAGGLADSQASGDLPTVQVLQDGAPGSTDEGRAMLELIHDIAPDASLAFATGDGGIQTFANNIIALKNAGCNVIVDDKTYFVEPFYQEGVVSQAITQVVNAGVSYFSSAANSGFAGFERAGDYHQFGDGSVYVDFDPSASTFDTAMTITTTAASTVIFQWSNPWNGVVGNVSADMDIYFLDSTGTFVVAAGTDDNFATGQPVELVPLAAGTYQVRIQLFASTPGVPLPALYKFTGRLGTLTTEYTGLRSATFGHNAGINTVSVGAVPFFSAPPYSSATPIHNETFSSAGPVNYVFNPDGTLKGSIQTLNKPDLSSIDGTNTTFFVPGGDIPQDPDTLPNFFGTSAAAPNAAAVAALIKELKPSATQADILAAMTATARPLNGTAAGTWDPQGGYGLIDAVHALSVFDPDDQTSEALTLTAGTTNIGSIDPDTDVDMYSFTASAGQTLSFDIDLPSSTLNSYIRLFNGSGTQLAANDNGVGAAPEYSANESFLQFTFPSSGTYYLAVSDSINTSYNATSGSGDLLGGTTGTYSLKMSVVTPPEIRVQLGAANVSDGQTTPIDFGNVQQGQTGPELTFTVFNDGDQTLTLGSVGVPAGYTVTKALPVSIAGGSSDTLKVRLDSANVGTKSGQLSFGNNDGDENPFDFPITGAVTVPGLVPGAGAVFALTGSAGSQTLAVTAGTVTLTADLSLSLPGLSLSASGGASVLFNSAQHFASLTVTGGATATDAGGTLTVGALSIDGTSALDLKNNDLLVDRIATPAATIRSYLVAGYAGNQWTGPGIRSSTAAGDPSHFSLGYADGGVTADAPPGQVLVRYTRRGDANLDRKVDIQDLLRFRANAGTPTPAQWWQADFTYDGKVDIQDLLAFRANAGLSVPEVIAAAAASVTYTSQHTAAAPGIFATATAITSGDTDDQNRLEV
jgi:hypothetical protein